MRRILFAAFLLGLVFPSAAFPCSCGSFEPEVLDEYADAIFTATPLRERMILAPEGPEHEVALFRVDLAVGRVWKGDVHETISVLTSITGPACGVRFDPGREYLVWAYKRAGDSRWYTSLCNGTGVLHLMAPKQLQYLGSSRRTFDRRAKPAGAVTVRADRVAAALKMPAVFWRARGELDLEWLESPSFFPLLAISLLGAALVAALLRFAGERSDIFRRALRWIQAVAVHPATTAMILLIVALLWWKSLYERDADFGIPWIVSDVVASTHATLPLIALLTAAIAAGLRGLTPERRRLASRIVPLALLILLFAGELSYTWSSFDLWPWAEYSFGPSATPLGFAVFALFPADSFLARPGATLAVAAVLAALIFWMTRTRRGPYAGGVVLLLLLFPTDPWWGAVLAAIG